MTIRTRLALVAVTCTVVTALAGCATTAPAAGTSASSTTVATPTTEPSPTTTATPTPTPSAAPPSTPTPTADALARHVHDLCSTGAAEAGITLTFTAHPDGYTGSDGRYHLVYPFTFDDGHEDPYAVWNCTLSDDGVDSTFVGSGITDSH
ncbi:hypothetical protein [Curtobacterium sp. L1-20]|uniref:hypothetical protein n=1 Tax=Curtobacterium sp. L1-20 TaxID=3138181 RepID=UPI003B529F0A